MVHRRLRHRRPEGCEGVACRARRLAGLAKKKGPIMEFGITVLSKPQNFASDTKLAEERGFTHAWFADVPMSYGDMFVAMGLAAAATHRIKIGAGIAIASNRSAAVTANAIATIN